MTDKLSLYDVHARCLCVLEMVAPLMGQPISESLILRDSADRTLATVEAHLTIALTAIRAVRSEQVVL
jgi:hypothetical protein